MAADRAWPWHRRLASAATRRVRAWCRSAADDHRPTPVESAVNWLNQQSRSVGLAVRCGAPPCPGLTAALLPTLLEFGQLELLEDWLGWLLSAQRSDGSFTQAGMDVGSFLNTAEALVALTELAAAGMVVAHDPARRAAEYLNQRLADFSLAGTGGDRRLRTAVSVRCAAALSGAGPWLGSKRWQQTADDVLVRSRGAVDWHLWNEPGRLVVQAADAWLTLGEVDLARDILRWPSSRQRRDGSVPATEHATWGENDVLAHLSALWFRLGERDRADRALAFLHRQQRPSGGWWQRWGRSLPTGESAWAVNHYLDAARLQVATSFDQPNELPTAIAANDGRLVAVRDWLATLGIAPKVADVGCGPGRFLCELRRVVPHARLVGIDPAPAMLRRLPPGIESRTGSLLRIPAGDGEFDGVFAVESLEHSLLPERAVDELCRVVRPGGKILIIDKHRARQPLSLHQPWERWFLPETVEHWMARHCGDLRVEPITHGPAGKTGLFLCWQGTRRACAYASPAEVSGSVPKLARNSLISPAA
ncbi:MAG TPA: methyltransferase domain-containing protein [Pirellulales bacterium]|nr:methyltransferase domain-containing protein [Pirellulales bacterium]